ncbi:hypothetical protein H257_04442 [Aphanomyces astaci]|uniref:Uncharacterized protein n=1 Tax=Aphanomyces astaci TaxID=112090 RepID=W4GWX2_APHAT|nr:hypothetical protein H257_04442 [Aphanomyces astaci]ETV83831.1 hypothetical protein H257_04442 [Aphanomyces astaci]|eukprot:XP_009827261.1 hypothetical protein H257_04442 [Aphanomyces astaci]
MRNLYVNSQSFTTRAYLALPDEVKFWDCELSGTPEVEDQFKRHASAVAWRQYNAGNQTLHSSVFGLLGR